MIPLQIKLTNFLSYRDAALDFRGLHAACICGPNGAGKSSLLEAMAWAIWGNSRAGTEDDVIHAGTGEVRVDFTFSCDRQIYRVIRSRQLGKTTTVEFQIATDEEGNSFRAISDRTARSTQDKIIQHLKLDYETFVNSAYLRQGRADEFMLKKPAERKQVLAGLLRLERYESLANQAKDISAQLKGKIQLLEGQLSSLGDRLQQKETIAAEITTLETQLAQLQAAQTADREQLSRWQQASAQRQTGQQQLEFLRRNRDGLQREHHRLQQELQAIHRQSQTLTALLEQEAEITAGYAQFQQLQAQEETLTAQLHQYQNAQNRRTHIQAQLQEQSRDKELKRQQIQAQLEAISQQEAELQNILAQAPEVEAAIIKQQEARARLQQLDRLQAEVTPLLRRRENLQSELISRKARTQARLEEIATTAHRLYSLQQERGKVQQAVLEVEQKIEELEKKRNYQQRVREKGLERRSFLERLQAHQREYETQLAEIEHKIRMLGNDAICPLCDRPLDSHHWELVMQKHENQHQETQNRLWVVREQMAVSDREIQLLRQEYQGLSRELAAADALQKQYGGLQVQLEMTTADRERLAQLAREKQHLEHALQSGSFAGNLAAEVQHLEQSLAQLGYDEKNHALARSDVERWRWAEIKHAQIKDARERLNQLSARRPQLETSLEQIRLELENSEKDSQWRRQLEEIEQELETLKFSVAEHQTISAARTRAQVWLLRAEQLRRAQQEYPQITAKAAEIEQHLEMRREEIQEFDREIDSIQKQLAAIPPTDIPKLEKQIATRRVELDNRLAALGRWQQKKQHLEALEQQRTTLSAELQTARRQYRVYSELAAAFGKNGIPTLTIENILPILEAETNHILARLTGNALHVRFITQKASRSGKKQAKLIDTLDIEIADAKGTRPYETYSGGEAFRINFAIRLALARLLCSRQGTRLQMLIVDEGFGTQDGEGCDRLIAAINAIAPEFAAILIVTHMNKFKEAFTSRIEVRKTDEGSRLSVYA
ncbi:exonuclease subunit SbcC [[Phormidium] sp. ETS-05]|uniref:exonuclease subunit SbcC n=1 Tax=[Phormidium] sp. ETS-05 TaxID=222819 RepID=UPI0018EF0E0A|nr:exonuclease subunit SbcC [[Phormidium] sp. ETS-05]